MGPGIGKRSACLASQFLLNMEGYYKNMDNQRNNFV